MNGFMVHFLLQIIICISFIIFVDYLWNFFKEKFTIKKTKDLNTTIEKYKSLVETNYSTNILDDNPVSLEEVNLIESDLNVFLNDIILQKEVISNNDIL
jgi:hypothetical protein